MLLMREPAPIDFPNLSLVPWVQSIRAGIRNDYIWHDRAKTLAGEKELDCRR
jgi:hypothetical protein